LDKNKIIEAAAKLVAKGAYDKAIKEYQKVLEADPKDVRILQKMGELFQKKNDNAQAAVYFTRVAESYTNDGFFLKAVALYKQVLKLDPTLLEINVKLAELHQQLQLLGEAMAYYQIVANHYDKSGDTRKSLEVLRKMVELDPDNVASRVKLADLFVREGLSAEAATEFKRAAEHLKRSNRVDDYLRVAERLSTLEPDNLPLARELAELYLQRNDQKRALAKLQICFKADNRDIDTLRLLGVAFQGLGQTSKTISVFKELARAYEEKGQGEEAEQVWQQVEQLDPNDGDVAARRGPVAPPEPPPQYTAPMPTMQAPAYVPQAARRTGVTEAHAPQATAVQGAHLPPAAKKPDNIGKLLTETDVYVKYGLHDKALEHLRKVFASEPENIDAHEKAYAIYVASNNHAQAFEQLLNVLRLHTRTADAPRAQQYLQAILEQNPGHPEVPIFLQALRMAGTAPMQAPESDGHERSNDDAILVDSSDDEVIVPDESQDEVISAEVALSHEEAYEAPEVLADEVGLSPDDAWAAAQVPVDPPPVADEFDEQPWGTEPEQAPASHTQDEGVDEPNTGEYALAEDADELDTGAMGIPVSSVSGQRPLDGPPVPELYDEPPAMGLGEEEHQAPTRMVPAFDPRGLQTTTVAPVYDPTTRVAPSYNPAATMADDDFSGVEPGSAFAEPAFAEPEEADYQTQATPMPEEEAVEAPPEEEPASEEVDEATFFIDQGLYDEAREILETVLIAYPEHQRAAQLLAQVDVAQNGGGAAVPSDELSAPPMNTGERDAFNLAAELANELGELEQQSPEPPAGDDYQVSVDEVFAEFKKGLEKVVKPEDVETHYDLGVAYKEMGLMEDAVSEFTIARKGCVGKRKEIDCLSMIGMLQVMRGDFPPAIDAFLQALTSEHSKDDVEKSLRFDLGGAYEAASQPGRALAQYLKVQQLDPSYREVGDHVERLSAVTSPEDDAPPPPQRSGGGGGGGKPGVRKVGFV
jgi:tetratricopeptide (TPR) repeat protein